MVWGNRVSSFLNCFGSLVLLSGLWILCCLPVLTIIPATAALYYAAAKAVRRGAGYPAAEFFHCFRSNWKQGVLINVGVMTWGGIALEIVRFIHYVGAASFLGKVYLVFLAVTSLIILLTLAYLLPVITRFSVSLTDGIRIALVLSFQNLITLIPLMITGAAAAFLIYLVPAAVLFVPGCLAYLMSFSIERALREFFLKQTDHSEQFDGMWFMEQSEKENVHFLDYFHRNRRTHAEK